MDSVSKQEYASSLLFCPYAKFENKEDEFRSIQFGKSPTLSNAEYDKSSLSSSSHLLRPLDLCNNKDNTYECQVCYKNKVGASFYSCKECPKKLAADLPSTKSVSSQYQRTHIILNIFFDLSDVLGGKRVIRSNAHFV